jgi:hypothetical protein
MDFELVSLQVHLGRKDNEFLLQAFSLSAHEVVLTEMMLQGIIIKVVLWLSSPTIAQEASFVLCTAMHVEFVVTVESLTTESTERMPLESRLINRSRVIVSLLHMTIEVFIRKQLMFMRKDFFVPGAKIAHLLLMYAANVPVQVWPS